MSWFRCKHKFKDTKQVHKYEPDRPWDNKQVAITPSDIVTFRHKYVVNIRECKCSKHIIDEGFEYDSCISR